MKGQSFYVTHLEVKPNVGFSTKETPDNPHTKGAIKLKGTLTIFDNAEGQPEAIVS